MSALTQAKRVAAARQAYWNVQLRREFTHEYHEGRLAYEQGHRLDSCPYAADSLARSAWQLGWRDARRDEGS